MRSTPLSRKGKRPVPYDPPPFNLQYGSPQAYPMGSINIHHQRPLSWNKGQCAVPNGCTYTHVCSTCNSETHRARDCPKTPSSRGESSLPSSPPPTGSKQQNRDRNAIDQGSYICISHPHCVRPGCKRSCYNIHHTAYHAGLAAARMPTVTRATQIYMQCRTTAQTVRGPLRF